MNRSIVYHYNEVLDLGSLTTLYSTEGQAPFVSIKNEPDKMLYNMHIIYTRKNKDRL
jgi:hypothetical protein